MAFFNEFPNRRSYDSDLGWLLANVKALIDEIDALEDTTGEHTAEIADLKEKVQALFDALEEPVKPWEPTVYYRMYQTVEYNGMYYTAIKDVPAGIGIGDTNYWIASSGVMTVITVMQNSLETLQEQYDTLSDDLGAETEARKNADNIFKSNIERAQLDTEGITANVEISSDYVPGKGCIYDENIVMSDGSNARFFINLFIAGSNMKAPQVAKQLKSRALIAGPARNKYIIRGVMYGNDIPEALYWVGDSSTYGFHTRKVGVDTDEQLCARYDRYAFLCWSPLITYNNPFTPPADVMNKILSNGNTFSDALWYRPHPRQVLMLRQNPDANNQWEIHFIAFSGREYGDEGFTCPDMIDYILEKYPGSKPLVVNMDGGGNTVLYTGASRVTPPYNPYNRNTFAYLYIGDRNDQ